MWLVWILVALIGIPVGLIVLLNLLKLCFALISDLAGIVTSLLVFALLIFLFLVFI